MIENIKRFVNEHHTLMVVIIGALVICTLYCFLCRREALENKIRGGFESGLYYAYDANDVEVGRVALYDTVYIPHPDAFVVIHRLLEHIGRDANNKKIDNILGILDKTSPYWSITDGKLSNSTKFVRKGANNFGYPTLNKSIIHMSFGGQPVELNNTEYKFGEEEVYKISQFSGSIGVANFRYFNPPDSGVSNSHNKYINNLSSRTRAWQPKNDDKRWKSYPSTKTGGAKVDIYPASFSVVFGLYLFLPMLVDLNTVKAKFKGASSEIFPETR